MRIALGDTPAYYIPPACESISQASSTSCVVVPGVTKGTIVMPDQPLSNVVFGQLVDITTQNADAYSQNIAAAQAAGAPVVSTADPGAVPALSTAAAGTTATTATSAQPADDKTWLYLAAACLAAALIFR